MRAARLRRQSEFLHLAKRLHLTECVLHSLNRALSFWMARTEREGDEAEQLSDFGHGSIMEGPSCKTSALLGKSGAAGDWNIRLIRIGPFHGEIRR
jgi:hypothetical protein